MGITASFVKLAVLPVIRLTIPAPSLIGLMSLIELGNWGIYLKIECWGLKVEKISLPENFRNNSNKI